MKKGCLFLAFLFLCATFAGCLNPVSLDKYGYVVAVGVEAGKQKKYNVLFLIQKESMGTESDTGGGVLLGAEGDNIYEAIAVMESSVPYEINLSRVMFMMFSETVARSGMMQDFLSMSFSSLKMRYSINAMVVSGDLQRYMEGFNMENFPNMAKLQSNLIGRYKDPVWSRIMTLAELQEAVQSARFDAAIPYGTYNESVITAQDAKSADKGEEPPEHIDTTGGVQRLGGMKSSVYGAALFDGWRMVGVLPGEDTVFLLMGSGLYQKGSLTFSDRNGNIVSVYLIEAAAPQVSFRDNGVPTVKVCLKFLCSIDYDSASTDEVRTKNITEDLESYLQAEIQRVFVDCQRIGSDCFGFGRNAVKCFCSTGAWDAYDWNTKFPLLQAKFDVAIEMTNEISRSE